MARIARIFLGCCAVVVVVLAAVIAAYRLTYDREFDAVSAAIRAQPGLEIVDQWRHEDVTLEDFGFLVRAKGRLFWMDIIDDTRVRMPDDRIAGIEFSVRGEQGRRSVSFSSPYWRDADLPQVATVDEFLRQAGTIVPALIANPPPETNLRGGPYAEYSLYLRVTWDPKREASL